MKKMIVFLCTILVFVFLSCQKNEVPLVIPGPQVNFFQAPSQVEFGDSALIQWDVSGVEKIEMFVNGVWIPVLKHENSKLLTSLTEEVYYEVTFKGVMGSKPETRKGTIEVAEPVVPTTTDSLCNGSWRLIDIKVFDDERKEWVDLELTDGEKSQKLFFFRSKEYRAYQAGVLFSQGKWNLTGKNSILMGDQNYIYEFGDSGNLFILKNEKIQITYKHEERL